MKKSTLVAMILGTVGGVFFALGMCMALLPEWGMFNQGIACGVIGLVILLVDLLIWRRMEGKAPIHVTPKAVGTVVVGVLGRCCSGWASACPWCLGIWCWVLRSVLQASLCCCY